MKKNKIIIGLVFLSVYFSLLLLSGFGGEVLAQPVMLWAKGMGGTVTTLGNSIDLDASGNVYTAGTFNGTSDFDPGAGASNLTSVGVFSSSNNIFVSKLNASGNFIWARQMGETSIDSRCNSMDVDGAGNVYTTGYFTGTGDFDPGAGVFNLTSVGGANIFVSKLDASGNFIWAKQLGTGSSVGKPGNGDVGHSIVVDGSGNVYTTGSFTFTGDFDPGPGTFNLSSVSGQENMFVSKLDASGNFIWAKRIGGIVNLGHLIRSHSIAVDGSGNAHITGAFFGTIDFDPGPLTLNFTSTSNNLDIFVCKLDNSGDFVWAKHMVGSAGTELGNSIAVDGSGNVYTTGQFTGTVDFDPGTGVFNLSVGGLGDIFISKLDAFGDFVWAKRIGGIGLDVGNGIAVDGSGNVYTTGRFGRTVDFDPGPGTFNLTATSPSFIDIFVSKLDNLGNFVCAFKMGGGTVDIGMDLFVTSIGDMYVTGFYDDLFADFDPGLGVFNLTTSGTQSAFVAAYSGGTCGISAPLSVTVISTNPVCFGQCTGTATATPSGGSLPYTFSWSPTGQTTSTATGLCAGVYTVSVTDAASSAATATVTITQPSALVLVTSDATICAGNNASLSVTVSGGTPPYIYVWIPATDLNGATISNPVASPTVTTTYTVTVTDANGCTSTATATVFVNPNPSIDAGPDKMVMFSSCPPPSPPAQFACTVLQTTVTGGASPYTFLWLPASFLNNPNSAAPTACPTVTTTYSVTVTDANGCTGTDAVSVTAVDFCNPGFACNAGGQMIQICHAATCTQDCVNKNANCSSVNSLCAHLLHGDYVGPCTTSCKTTPPVIVEEDALENRIKVYPNPFSDYTTISLHLLYSGKVKLEMYNLLGKKVATLFDNYADSGTLNISFSGNGLPEGVYLCKFILSDKEYFQKLLVVNRY